MIVIHNELPRAMNKVMRSHHFKNHSDAKKWKNLVGTAVTLFKPDEPLKKFKVTATRSYYRMLDYDGLVASLKPCIDGLKGIVIEDDSWAHTGAWDVSQEFLPKKQGSKLKITIQSY